MNWTPLLKINKSRRNTLEGTVNEQVLCSGRHIKAKFRVGPANNLVQLPIQQECVAKLQEEEAEFEGGGEDMSCLPPEWMLDMINHSLIEAHSKQMATYRALKEQFKDLKETIDNNLFEFGTLNEAISKMNNLISEEKSLIYCYINKRKRFIVSTLEFKNVEPYYILSFF